MTKLKKGQIIRYIADGDVYLMLSDPDRDNLQRFLVLKGESHPNDWTSFDFIQYLGEFYEILL